MCSTATKMCGELVSQPYKDHAIIRERGARGISSTSLEPYHRNGRQMDWSTGESLCAPTSNRRFSICVLCCPSFPALGRTPRPVISLSIVSQFIHRSVSWPLIHHGYTGRFCPLNFRAQLPCKLGSSSARSSANRKWLHRCRATSRGPALHGPVQVQSDTGAPGRPDCHPVYVMVS